MKSRNAESPVAEDTITKFSNLNCNQIAMGYGRNIQYYKKIKVDFGIKGGIYEKKYIQDNRYNFSYISNSDWNYVFN